MFNSLVKDALLIGLCALVSVTYLSNREPINHYIATLAANILETLEPQNSENSATGKASDFANRKPESSDSFSDTSSGTSSGRRVSIKKNKTDGQFWANARVNNGNVRFLIDTGASLVILTLDDAKEIGIRTQDLKYNVPITTANGVNMAAPITLKSISIGSIRLKNIPALILDEGLHISLLGMSFLGELKKLEVTQEKIILKL